LFKVLQSEVFPIRLYSNEGESYPTRDILYVQGQFENEIWHVLINHWQSRREGDFESDHKRYIAAQQLTDIIDPIYYENPDAKFILMGDFNTDPDDENIKLLDKRFFNPAHNLYKNHQGSLNHHHKWHLFDQILFSYNFTKPIGWTFESFHIFKPDFLQIWKGQKKHQPYRTYQGRHYKGGFSDHFPVYAILKHFNKA
jgi:endonuclease/exonuclease/phosphatase family metal-dependent hydrolase